MVLKVIPLREAQRAKQSKLEVWHDESHDERKAGDFGVRDTTP